MYDFSRSLEESTAAQSEVARTMIQVGSNWVIVVIPKQTASRPSVVRMANTGFIGCGDGGRLLGEHQFFGEGDGVDFRPVLFASGVSLRRG